MSHPLPTFNQILDILVKDMGWSYENIGGIIGFSTRTIYRWRDTSSAATYIARKHLYTTYIKGTEHDPHHS